MKRFLRMKPELFHYKFQCFRNMHFNKFLDITKGIPLPFDAVIHDLGSMSISGSVVPDIPSLDNIFNFQRRYLIYNNNPLIPSSFSYYEFPKDKFRVLPAGLLSKINKFRVAYGKRIKVTPNLSTLDSGRKDQISLVNERPLGSVRLTGILQGKRYIDHILNGMLDKISQLPPHINHLIMVPLPKVTYKRKDFLSIIKRGYFPSTVVYPRDPFYLFISNLICYSNITEHETPFDKLPTVKSEVDFDENGNPTSIKLDSKISFIFYNEKYYCIYSLADLMDKFNQGLIFVDKFLFQLKKMIQMDTDIIVEEPDIDNDVEEIELKEQNFDQDELEDNLDIDKINNIEVIEKDIPITSLVIESKKELLPNKDKREVEESKEVKGYVSDKLDVSAFDMVLIDRLPGTTKHEKIVTVKEKVIDINSTSDLPKEIIKNKKIQKLIAKPLVSGLITHESHLLKTEHYLDKEVHKLIENISPNLTEKQLNRIRENAHKWKEIEFGDKTLHDLMNDTNGLAPIETKDLSFLENEVHDKSYLKATTLSVDQNYVDKHYHRHIVSTVLHLHKTGTFVTDIKTKQVKNKLEDYTEYVFKFEDIKFKQHSVKVILPNIGEDGTLLSRGSVKKIYKQRVNKPICKISPTEVALFSDYNKYLVELVGPARNNLVGIMSRLLTKKNPDKIITYSQGRFLDPDNRYPLELTQLASYYSWIRINDILINFDLKQVSYDDSKEAYRIGTGTNKEVFINMNNEIIIYENDTLSERTFFIKLVCDTLKIPEPPITQWTELNIINKSFPIGIILAYKFGLEKMLKMINLDYDIYNKEDIRKIPKNSRDIRVVLNDVVIVCSSSPYRKAFIMNGLNKFDLSKYSLQDLSDNEVYYEVFSAAGYSPNYLLEINNFFDFFVDPVAYEILLHMNEPTTPEAILLRSTMMLEHMDHKPPSSASNFRTRAHGKIPAMLYNEITKQMAAHRRPMNQGGKFSINPQAVFQRIMQDALTENADVNNPIGAIKDQTTFSYTGFGGRSQESFVLRDRIFTKDNIGIVSDGTVDSSNVSIRAQYSLNASIKNSVGIEEPVPIEQVEPADMLSISSLLYPGITTSDNILSHLLVTVGMESL